jgi:hypothetical protein
MKELLKRHAFLLILGGGVVVLTAAIGLTVRFVYMAPSKEVARRLERAGRDAEELLSKPFYGQTLLEQIAREVEDRKARYGEIVDAIRQMGQARKPLVAGLFPVSTDVNLRHSFKAEYDAALSGLMARLQAVQPTVPENLAEADRLAEERKFEKARMFAHAKESFARPGWVDQAEAPPLEACRQAQEDLWLMEDIVGVIAQVNAEAGESATIRDVPIKELVEIRIGAASATLEGARSGSAGRYRSDAMGRTPGTAPTLSGRYSRPEFYLVLPFRVVVVADSRKGEELLRRLKGTESFLSVDAWHLKPMMEQTVGASRRFLAKARETYGSRGVVLLEIVGEALVFQLPGGRVTNPPLPPALPAEG